LVKESEDRALRYLREYFRKYEKPHQRTDICAHNVRHEEKRPEQALAARAALHQQGDRKAEYIFQYDDRNYIPQGVKERIVESGVFSESFNIITEADHIVCPENPVPVRRAVIKRAKKRVKQKDQVKQQCRRAKRQQR
jgi:hypothetical protein